MLGNALFEAVSGTNCDCIFSNFSNFFPIHSAAVRKLQKEARKYDLPLEKIENRIILCEFKYDFESNWVFVMTEL